MSTNHCLKIGDRLFCGDQIISALVEYKLFESLIGQVILDQMLKDVPLSKQEIYTALIESSGLPDISPIPDNFEEFLVQWCEQQDVTWDYLDKVILRDLRIEKFKRFYFNKKIESEFLRTKPELDRVEYSRIQVSDPVLAQELYFQLRDDGAEFAQLACQHASDSEQSGEQLATSWTESTCLAALPPEVADLLRTGEVGKIYEPIPVDEVFWIVKLEQIVPARLTDATRSVLIERLYDQWLQSQVKKLMSQPGAIALQSASLASTP
jgi:parvulin-like peptidyl-prolyl isomerase